MSEILKIDHLSCGYGERPVLNDVSLTVSEGEAVLIAGPNGCGKSTLARLIMGMEKPDAGEVWFRGQRIEHFALLACRHQNCAEHQHQA